MRILLVSNMYPDSKHPTYGIFVKKFYDELVKLEIHCEQCVMHQSDSSIEKIVGYLKFYIKSFYKAVFQRWDVIYIHYASHSSAPILAASRLRNFKIYTNVHGSDVVPENETQEKMQKYTRSILKKSAKIIVPSEYFKKYVQEKYKIQDTPFFVYPSGGINPEIFYDMGSTRKLDLKGKFGFNPEFPVFGMAGRISTGKGWDTFVKAIAQLVDLKANYVIAGEGKEADQLEQLILQLNLKKKIKRMNLLPQNQLAEFYNAIDFLVFPTRREGESLGLVPLEAMACATPVISSDFAAPKYYVVNGVNGYKFQVNNEYELALCIKKCANHYGLEMNYNMKAGALRTAQNFYVDYVRIRLQEIIKE